MTTDNWILILGANSDIARATAREFAFDGYNIQLASRNTKELEKEAEHLKVKFGIKAQVFYFDALDFDSHSEFYSGLNEKPAGVVAAFGTLGDEAMARQDFFKAQNIIETNYLGAVSILEIVAADFERRRWGFIIGISSVAGDRGRQSNYLYGSAKAGFTAFLAGLRHRLFAAGVSVLTVKPGFVDTKMTQGLGLPAKLTAPPKEVAEKIVKAMKKKKKVIYVKPIWKLIMLVIIHLPEWLFIRTKL